MNILFFSDNFPPECNATATRVYEQAWYWVKSGHSVTIIATAPNFPEGKLFPGYKNKLYQREIIDGIQVKRVKTFIARNKGFLLRTIDYISYLIPAFLAGLWQKKPDIIIATCPTPFAALAAWMTAAIRRVPFILEVSDLWPASIIAVGAMRKSFIIYLLEKLELFLYKQAQKIVVLTFAFQKNLIDRGVKSEKIATILNGVNLNKYSPTPKNLGLAARYGISADHFVVGYIGTFGMAHSLEHILYAAELLKDHPTIRFILVGTGAEREKLITLVTNKVLNNVCIIEQQPKEAIPAFWSLCDIALVHLKNSPVFAEVIPSKLFEAMGMGIPILISAPPGEATTIVIKEKIGVVLPPENPAALAETILSLGQNKKNLLPTFANHCIRAAPKYSREQQAYLVLKIMQTYTRKNKYDFLMSQ